MTRTKKAGRRDGVPKGKTTPANAANATAGPVSAASLIDKSHTLLAQSNFELAIKFLDRALELEPTNAEARELVGIAELEAGDEDRGREHLLQLFPPHAAEPPSHPSPYLYLAQSASEPQEALGYYSTATAMIEKRIAEQDRKGKGRQANDGEEEEEIDEERQMAVTALVAMIEIWMSDLCMEEAAEKNCDDLIQRALSISSNDPEVKLSLASIRMSQSRFDDAKQVVISLYNDLEGREPFDPILPALPVRLALSRLLLEHNQHLEALDIISTVREEDTLNIEGAYLEGWAFYLRAEAIKENPALLIAVPVSTVVEGEEPEEPMSAEECLSESMRSLIECARLYEDQSYEDEGIGSHVAELLEELEKKGVVPAIHEEEEDEDGDVEMA
ncbi:uncharacterized protein I303_106598 [Kwoniella dejecticola CBS 10117]|uniref:Uncharacterized protein n=1 Tax=Kwoniella dejecticola CBS 10117 TaxID=1296121 RepID=A0A1A5ZUA1_9TREE|nr:uncharacterized protein I303_08145 [Kwoniella dejecticola CBS 10117]OBR81375.1 hypothetical protein I303_08145 [Kwoniella dejecticola CBS 10117]